MGCDDGHEGLLTSQSILCLLIEVSMPPLMKHFCPKLGLKRLALTISFKELSRIEEYVKNQGEAKSGYQKPFWERNPVSSTNKL